MVTASTPGAPAFALTLSHASKTRRFEMSNDFTFSCGPLTGSSPEGLTAGGPDLPDPFAPASLQDHRRYYESARPCASHRYSAAHGTRRLRSSLSTTRGPTSPISTRSEEHTSE